MKRDWFPSLCWHTWAVRRYSFFKKNLEGKVIESVSNKKKNGFEIFQPI